MEKFGIANFTQIINWLRSLLNTELFDQEEILTENRPQIFNQLEILGASVGENDARLIEIEETIDQSIQTIGETASNDVRTQLLDLSLAFENLKRRRDRYSPTLAYMNHEELLQNWVKPFFYALEYNINKNTKLWVISERLKFNFS